MAWDGANAYAAWPPEHVAFAGKLWADGYSAGQIARNLRAEFGLIVTRNSVIGILHRRGLSGRSAASRPTRISDRRPPNPRPKRAPMLRIAGRGTVFVEAGARKPRAVIQFRQEEPGMVTVLTIGPHQCHWPIGDPLAEDFTFCGKGALVGSYCTHHTQIAFVPKAERTEAQAKADEQRRFKAIRRFGVAA